MIARIVLSAILIALGGFAEAAAAGEAFKDCPVCPSMEKVPAGKFMMGTAAEKDNSSYRTSDEQPQHSVTFKQPFALGQYPVTRGEFAVFVQETGHDPKGCFMPERTAVVLTQGLNWRNPGFTQTDRDPVVCVSFDDAKRYVKWLSTKTGKSYRLPSESEWEYAARAGTTTARYWSGGDAKACGFANVFDLVSVEAFNFKPEKSDEQEQERASFFKCRDGHVYTAPVGSFPPNAFGLYDMLGNVSQWIADCYAYDYGKAPTDGSVWEDPDNKQNQCPTRILRGGSWISPPFEVRSAYRHGDSPDHRDIFNGIRVARKL
jgi:sulfatase modifying factor 1